MSMGVYIKGMEMPKECCQCYLCYHDQDSEHNCSWWCAPLVKLITKDSFVPNGIKLDLCPLVPVPRHGRLIDADALDVIGYCDIPRGREDTFDSGVMWLAEQIDAAPTIIPAEEGEI